jgi:hypothetical protein
MMPRRRLSRTVSASDELSKFGPFCKLAARGPGVFRVHFEILPVTLMCCQAHVRGYVKLAAHK